MTDVTANTLGERATKGLFDAAAGGVAALVALTAAHAALPDRHQPIRRAAETTAPAAAVSAPAPAPVLIAFQDPLPGEDIASPFGLRQMPWEPSGRLHAGIDIPANSGTPIHVAADGVVVRSGQGGGYGRFVEVKHAEGLTTLYAHMGAIGREVRPGKVLKAGMTVGQVGSSGSSTGPHLHFEVRDAKDRPMNPEAFLGRAFAAADELPLAEARRVPRGVRVAFASRTPVGKAALVRTRFVRAEGQSANFAAARLAQAAETAAPAGVAPSLGFKPMHAPAEAVKPAAPNMVVGVGEDGRPKATLQL